MSGSEIAAEPRTAIGNTLEICGRKEPVYEAVEVPEHFGPVQLVVDEEKAKMFSYIIGDDELVYREKSGLQTVTATILANDLLQLFTLKYDASRVVGLHTEEQLWFGSPVRVGEVVTLEGTYVDKFERRGQGYVVMEAKAVGEDTRVLLRHRGTEIMRTEPGKVVGRRSARSTGRRVDCTYPADCHPVASISGHVMPGTPLLPRRHHLTEPQVCLFSRAGEYITNIHNNMERAQSAGLERPLVQGQQLVCVLATFLEQVFGDAWAYSGWLHVKFIKPVFAGEWVTAYGRVVKPLEQTSPRDLSLEVWTRTDADDVTVVGWAQASPVGG